MLRFHFAVVFVVLAIVVVDVPAERKSQTIKKKIKNISKKDNLTL